MKKIVEEARELLQLVQEFGLEEIEIETEGLKFRATRTGTAAPAHPSVPHPVHAAHPLPPAETPAVAPREAAAPAPEAKPGTVPIVSPMVGTFYRSSGPDKPPYVTEGSVVGPDTTVCIVEAMKLMNEIKAGVKGQIVQCLIPNEQPVKAGQTLFLVKPDA